jgi:hypothetical protein
VCCHRIMTSQAGAPRGQLACTFGCKQGLPSIAIVVYCLVSASVWPAYCLSCPCTGHRTVLHAPSYLEHIVYECACVLTALCLSTVLNHALRVLGTFQACNSHVPRVCVLVLSVLHMCTCTVPCRPVVQKIRSSSVHCLPAHAVHLCAVLAFL